MRRVIAPLAVIGLLIALCAPTAQAASPGRGPAADASVIAHWTPARMAKAQWRDRTMPIAKAKPGGGGTGAVTGASWTKGGDVVSGTGKVYFTMGGSGWICTGTVINDGNRPSTSIVLTAGHCAVDEASGAFATNWMFIPSFDTAPTYTCANTTYGCWTATALFAPTAFANAGGFTDIATYNDWAFAVVGLGSKGGQLDAKVKSFGIDMGAAAAGTKAYSFGYPAAGKYHGSDLTYCAGAITTDPNNGGKTWGLGCDMTGGSSGGPWFTSFSESTGAGTVSSLNSYGYSGVKYMYGPDFNADTQKTFDAALANSGGNQLVP